MTSERRRRRGAAPATPAADEPPADPVALAKGICLRLLTARPRTRHELREALLRKGVDEDTADGVLGRLNEIGLIDDAAFAEMWVRSRHDNQGLGRRALAVELRRKGVADSVTAEAVAAVDTDAERERARELVRRRLRTLRDRDEQATVRTLVGMLARKGYSEGMAFHVVRDELRAAGSDTSQFDELTVD